MFFRKPVESGACLLSLASSFEDTDYINERIIITLAELCVKCSPSVDCLRIYDNMFDNRKEELRGKVGPTLLTLNMNIVVKTLSSWKMTSNMNTSIQLHLNTDDTPLLDYIVT